LKAARDFECKHWLAPVEMLSDADVDAIYVATPIGLHSAHGEDVLLAGKHLWCEKPLAASLDQTNSLLRIARERGLVIAEAFMYLYHPQFGYLQRLAASDRLGPIHSIICRFGIPPLESPGFRLDPAQGGGAFLDVGSYPISAVTSLYPDIEPEVVAAEIAFAPGSRVDTSGRALLRYGGAVSITLEWAINCAYRNEIDLWGANGSVSTERVFSKPADYVPKFRFLDARGAEKFETGTRDNHFLRMLEAFRGLIDDRRAAETERDMIARRGRLVDAIRQFAVRGPS
jgi:NDP-hexose-3-ketoreductase